MTRMRRVMVVATTWVTLGVWVLLSSACIFPGVGRSIESPIVSIVRIGDLEPGVFEQRFRVDLRIRNPNEEDLELDGIDVKIDLNGNRLTRALTGERIVVPRLGETEVSLTATTTPFDWVRQLRSPEGAAEGLGYQLTGRVLLGGLAVWLPFESSGELLP